MAEITRAFYKNEKHNFKPSHHSIEQIYDVRAGTGHLGRLKVIVGNKRGSLTEFWILYVIGLQMFSQSPRVLLSIKHWKHM